jgi:hypothetical protein
MYTGDFCSIANSAMKLSLDDSDGWGYMCASCSMEMIGGRSQLIAIKAELMLHLSCNKCLLELRVRLVGCFRQFQPACPGSQAWQTARGADVDPLRPIQFFRPPAVPRGLPIPLTSIYECLAVHQGNGSIA